jgi:hypothetical protein
MKPYGELRAAKQSLPVYNKNRNKNRKNQKRRQLEIGGAFIFLTSKLSILRFFAATLTLARGLRGLWNRQANTTRK